MFLEWYFLEIFVEAMYNLWREIGTILLAYFPAQIKASYK